MAIIVFLQKKSITEHIAWTFSSRQICQMCARRVQRHTLSALSYLKTSEICFLSSFRVQKFQMVF